jgi:hypothetical protein
MGPATVAPIQLTTDGEAPPPQTALQRRRMKTQHKTAHERPRFFDGFDSVSTRILLPQMTVPLRDRKGSDD